jgi:hypothetical protein
MLTDAMILALQLAIIALIALPVVGFALRRRRFASSDGHIGYCAAPEAIRVAAVGPWRLPQLDERVFAITRARSPGR